MPTDAIARYTGLTNSNEVHERFAPELRVLTAAQRDGAVTLIASLTSLESWEQFRPAYGRSSLHTRRAWAQAISAILRVKTGKASRDTSNRRQGP